MQLNFKFRERTRCSMAKLVVTALLVLGMVTDLCQCLKMLSVEVPEYETVHNRARLRCNYDLERDNLYSVKWYKDGDEFYRYVPRDSPPSQVFHVPGIRVDQYQSDMKQVTLSDLEVLSSGVYTCEASSEAPRFKTISGQAKMKVLDLPDRSPVLEGGKARGYRVGEWLDVNCTSPNSKPPATLKWYINNEQVDPSYVQYQTPIREPNSLYTSVLRLRFRLRRNHFIQDHVTVKCTATIYSHYFESSELYLPGIGLGEKALESRGTNDVSQARISSLALLIFPLISARFHLP